MVNKIIDTIQFIEEHFAQQISINEIERVSCYSYRNFQRIFKSTCGENIGAFQKRLKLENAYKMLLFNKTAIKEIAFEVGFETPAALTKSFKQYFGFPPSDIRLHKELIFKNNKIINSPATEKLDFEIVSMPKQQVYYSRIITSYESPAIETHWNSFMQFGFHDSCDFYGIILDETIITEDLKCRYDACSSQQALLKVLPQKEIFGGKYVKFEHLGSYDTLHETYNKIYAQWMIQSDLTFSNLPPIEHYLTDENGKNSHKTSIFIPIS